MSSLEALFCYVDDFCRVFEPKLEQTRLSADNKARKRGKILTLSEIMTILIAFHQNHYRNFQHFYLDHVCVHWRQEFPQLPSYQRFIEWIPSTLIPLCVYWKHCFDFCSRSIFS
jgi:hypothetical protein